MGELAFVGLGLSDEEGVPPRSRAVLAASGAVFAEEYTALAPAGTLDRLGRLLGRPVVRLDRTLLESETPILEALRLHDRVALLVVGDPFAATTHVALRLAAERAGHRWSYYPNASILTAAASLLGLMHYRFGRTVSLPFPADGFEPRSPLEQVAGNRERGLHTLLLLDLRPAEGKFLTASDALRLLRERDPDQRLLAEDDRVAVVARVGREDAAAWVGAFREMRGLDFGPPLHAVVIPAPTLHFEEEAAVARFTLGRTRPNATGSPR